MALMLMGGLDHGSPSGSSENRVLGARAFSIDRRGAVLHVAAVSAPHTEDTGSGGTPAPSTPGLLPLVTLTLSLVALVVASYAAMQVKGLTAQVERATAKHAAWVGEGQSGGDVEERAQRAAALAARTRTRPDAQGQPGAAERARSEAARPEARSRPKTAPAAVPNPKDPSASADVDRKEAAGTQMAQEVAAALGGTEEQLTAVLQILANEGRARTRLVASAEERGMDAKQVAGRKQRLRDYADEAVKGVVDAEQLKRYLALRKTWDERAEASPP